MSGNIEQRTQKKFDRLALLFGILDRFESRKMEVLREKLLSNLKGKILEVAVGSGKNLSIYNKDAEVTAIDLSQKMLYVAAKKKKGTLLQMNAEKLEFPHSTFDYVVSFLTLCAIPNPGRALNEMKRVLKKSGTIILVEHGLSNHGFISFIQKMLDPLWKITIGCSLKKNIAKYIKEAKLKVIKNKKVMAKDVFQYYICKPR